MNTAPIACVCGQTVVVKQVDKTNHVVSCPGCYASSGYRKTPTEAVQAWTRLMTPPLVTLSANQIDDMAFGYVPSGKIGELREFAQALLATAADVAQVKAVLSGAPGDTERLDWVLNNRMLRVQGSDASGWCVLNCSNGLTFMVQHAATAREAIDAARTIQESAKVPA